MRPERLSGTVLVLAAATLWGTTGTAQSFAPEGASALTVGALRLLIGGAALLLLAYWRGVLRDGPAWPRGAVAWGVLGVAAYQVCFFAGVQRAGVATGTLVGIGSAPIIAGFLAYIVRGERLTSRWIIATALAVTGCALLVLPGAEDGARVDPLGIILALGAGLWYAIYTIASKKLLETHPPDAVTAVVFALGALALAPLLLTGDVSWVLKPAGILVGLHLGFITTALAYVFFARGLTTVPAGVAVTLTLAEPLTAGILGVVVVGEQLAPIALVGIGLLFAGLALLVLSPRRRPRPAVG